MTTPERDALDELLAGMETEHGPADEGEIAAIIQRLTELAVTRPGGGGG